MGIIDEIADRHVAQFAEIDPAGATAIGINGHDHLMNDLSPAGFTAHHDLDRATMAALEAATPAGEREQTARAVMLERLAVASELYTSGVTTSELNVLSSWVQQVREIFDLMPLEGDEALRNLASRMAAVPAAYAGLRQTYAEAAADGRVSARRQVIACAEQCAEWSAPGRDFYSGLAARTNATGTLRADLDRAAVAASAATAELGAFLTAELLPLAPSATRWAAISTPSPRARSSAQRSTWTRRTPGAGPR